jgi:ribosome-associated heat shock protein Hsp15
MDKITEKVRLDVYLWAIRMYKTRSQSNLAIVSGKARKADQDLKPSYNVSVGDVFQIRNSDRKMTIQVTQLISKRVQYGQAILHYADISTDLDKEFNANKMSSSFYTGKRLSKVGRPTKKDARDISEFLDNDE